MLEVEDGGFGVLAAFGGSCEWSGELTDAVEAVIEAAATMVWSPKSGFGSLVSLEAFEKTPCIGLH